MKFVRTAKGYQALTLEDVTVTGTPQEVSNEKATALEKAGEDAGVTVLVFDSSDEAREGLSTARALGTAQADLSAGVAAVYGTGDPVQSPGTAVDGDEPEQARAQDQVAAPSAAQKAAEQAAATPKVSN